MKTFHFSLFCILIVVLSACDDSSSNATESITPSCSSNVPSPKSSSIVESISSSIGTQSSSSETQTSKSSSSSSKKQIESSSTIVKEETVNYNPDTGLLTDERNGETYKTAKIGNQIWMAENLNFDISDYPNIIEDPDFYGRNPGYEKESICPKKSTEADCEKYGRLYTQKGFLLSLNDIRVFKKFPTVPDSIQPYQGVCPKGWHIPNFKEWQTLFDNAYLNELISVEDGGNNKSGFNSKNIGFAFNESQEIYEETFGYDSTLTVYASVSEATANDIEAIWISERNAQVLQASKELFFAVRCLKD
jgi:uncharacterized protein (TIGR02145 family)